VIELRDARIHSGALSKGWSAYELRDRDRRYRLVYKSLPGQNDLVAPVIENDDGNF
jgi:hypothetical protein